MMTKKDFRFIAGIISNLPSEMAKCEATTAFTRAFVEYGNLRFDIAKFVVACLPIPTDKSK